MPRCRAHPLRSLTEAEQAELQRISRSQTEPAVRVARATMPLAVAGGAESLQAAQAVGRRSGDAVSHLVARFNQEGLEALTPRHGGGQKRVYGEQQAERILREAARTPTPETDGTATWSLAFLQRALRTAPDGLPNVSINTIWKVLRSHGVSHQKSRTWCPTGTVRRMRKAGPVVITDPDTVRKKS